MAVSPRCFPVTWPLLPFYPLSCSFSHGIAVETKDSGPDPGPACSGLVTVPTDQYDSKRSLTLFFSRISVHP